MRIVSWNCGGWSCGGFTIEKYNEMKQFIEAGPMSSDILIIQECTKKEFVKVSRNDDWFNFNFRTLDFSSLGDDYYDKEFGDWYGDNDEESYKGLAIISPNNTIELVDNFNSKFRYVIPYKINSHIDQLLNIENNMIILSIWTKQPPDGSWDYQKTIFDALDYYNFDIPIVLVGDFNTGSNSKNVHRYEELKTKLKEYGLKNCALDTEYEYEPTFYHDKTNNYFTNDFCFIPENFNVYEYKVSKMNSQKRWLGLSDHCPIIAEFGQLAFEDKIEIEKK